MKLPFTALLTLAALVSTAASAREYSAIQTEKSRVTFVSKQMGAPVSGRFAKFSAQIAFDAARPETGKAVISIDLASIDAGSKDANDEVVGKAWFNVPVFPVATFTSASIRPLGAGRFEVSGVLSIKGKSLPVTAPFAFRSDGEQGVFEGGFVLKRNDFSIGDGAWADVSMVANEVQVGFYLVATTTSRPALLPPKSR